MLKIVPPTRPPGPGFATASTPVTSARTDRTVRTDRTSERATDTAMEERLLGTVLANLEGMVYRCRPDADWTMEFVSEGCAGLTGYRVEDIILNSRVSYEEITHPDDRLRIRSSIFEAIAHRRRFEIEYRIVRADGSIRWVWERGMGIVDGNAALVALEGFIQDITGRVEAEKALREAERRYRSIFENAVEGIFQSTPNKGYIAVNPALVRIYGYASAAELIDSLRDIERQLYVDPHRRVEFMRQMEARGVVSNFESQVYRQDGEIIWISENARAVRGTAGEIIFFEGTVEAITERKLHEAEIRHQATHDALTGLPNRTLLYDRMKQATLHAQRHGKLAAVIFLDLDQFKYINDSLGHQIGDQLLKTVAQRLASCLRESDTVARQGGDEFVLVLTDQDTEDAITQTMQRVLLTVAKPWVANGMEFQVTCSMGVSLCPTDGVDVETLLRKADSAMYKAKELGRNNFQFFSDEMNIFVTDRLEMLNSLRRALAAQDFVLHYQPRVSLDSGKLVGMEALVRWQHPDKGLIAPGDFIPVAEESGLILPIGEWVLRTACEYNVALQQAGHPPIAVAVNLSPLQLERGNIVELVARVLAATGLAPEYLELEITESIVMRNVGSSQATLEKLKELGVRISIDDFGTGYSSLSYLKRFPVDIIKIDQSFVRDIVIDQDDAAIVKAIISLGHILNLNVVAEGVETEEQYRFLLENGCDEVQGFFVGRPMAALSAERP